MFGPMKEAQEEEEEEEEEEEDDEDFHPTKNSLAQCEIG
jgi:hypothetical protein